MNAQAALAPVDRQATSEPPDLVRALNHQLRSLRETVAGLSGDLYRAAQGRSSGSIGGHVRHCLDHVRALLAADARMEMTYDSRLRGTRVESDPATAIDELERLSLALEDISGTSLHDPIQLAALVDHDGPVVRISTSVGREIAFVLQHTIHHCAIVAVLLERNGIAVGSRFGYAPSTPIGRAETASTQLTIRSACGSHESQEISARDSLELPRASAASRAAGAGGTGAPARVSKVGPHAH